MWASVVVARGLWSKGSVVAQGLYLPLGMWNLPGPEIKPMCPALAGRFLSTAPPGKFKSNFLSTSFSPHVLLLSSLIQTHGFNGTIILETLSSSHLAQNSLLSSKSEVLMDSPEYHRLNFLPHSSVSLFYHVNIITTCHLSKSEN